MSSELREFALGEICRFTAGSAFSPDEQGSLEGDHPFIKVSDMNLPGNEVVIRTANNYVSEAQRLRMKAKLHPPGATVFAKIGVALTSNRRRQLGVPTIIDNNMMSASAIQDLVQPRFLYYLLTTLDFNTIAAGTALPYLNVSDLQRIAVEIPCLELQSAIENTLSAFDYRIALLRETNATLEAIAQALFKSWFVDFDPVRAKSQGLAPAGMDEATSALFPEGFEESAQGPLPKGWRVAPVGEVVEGIYDGPHATPPESGEGPVFLGIKNLTGTGLDLGEVRHIAENDFGQWTRRVLPSAGDIVFSYEATLGFFALVPPGLRCCLGRRLALIRPRPDAADGHFFFHQFIAAPFQRLLERHTIQGATVNRIALKHFPTYPVMDPPPAVKAAFDATVAPIWARIHANQAQAQTLTRTRDTLLPRLISGQIRLPEATPEAGLALAN